ncbi:hypothetical protein KIL84_002226 [Mauremys mutica]|uniref:Uncharacterized protein n=1 Tax=Mauremys mutica TaxID=74926 RepID=A0A9D3X5U6_9SAUR|nr:hypothetical protein KIL84_002226 [Mauremys mutica]
MHSSQGRIQTCYSEARLSSGCCSKHSDWVYFLSSLQKYPQALSIHPGTHSPRQPPHSAEAEPAEVSQYKHTHSAAFLPGSEFERDPRACGMQSCRNPPQSPGRLPQVDGSYASAERRSASVSE